jgi:hypothetical protein
MAAVKATCFRDTTWVPQKARLRLDRRPTVHARMDETVLQSSVLVQAREQLGDRNPDRGPRHFNCNGIDFNKARTPGHVGMAG